MNENRKVATQRSEGKSVLTSRSKNICVLGGFEEKSPEDYGT